MPTFFNSCLLSFIFIVCKGDIMNEKILRRYVRSILKEYYLMEKFKLKISAKAPKMPKLPKMSKGIKKQKAQHDISNISDQIEDLKKEEEIKKELGENYS